MRRSTARFMAWMNGRTWTISRPVPMLGLSLLIAVCLFSSRTHNYGWVDLIGGILCMIVGLGSLGFALLSVIGLVQKSPERSDHTLYLIASLLVFLAMFSGFYFHLSHYNPNSFNTGKPLSVVTSIYFTVVTFATVGYGDFYPTTDLARGIVAVEIVFAMLYAVMVFSVIGTLIARLAERKPDSE